MKKVLFTQRSDYPHWVGDGFPVRTIFSYNDIAKEISPFLLMDYAGPTEFPPSKHIRGVESHPHRGFETVTIVYDGEVEHRDSAGGGGIIKSGDVQWMTAASGLVHEEKHGKNFARDGGRFEMVQLWVNLPKKDKMTNPRYQGLTSAQIPKIELENGAGFLRVIAGQFQNAKGPAKTFSPINLWDIRLNSGAYVNLKVPTGQTTAVFVLSGQLTIGSHKLGAAEMAVLDHDSDFIQMSASQESKILFLGGEPLNEPIIGYGPFVMNTQSEIAEAFRDFEAGKMGVIDSIAGSD
jgi:quercetin 2,3-dioxygenase